MKKFLIITNEYKDHNLSVTHSIQDYIQAKGGQSCYYVSSKSEWSKKMMNAIHEKNVDADCMIVLGGDGTLVRVARDTTGIGIPLIGVNLGTLGYLCELDKSSVFQAIDQIFEDQYEIEERMMIEGKSLTAFSSENTKALNDIVIHRIGSAQMIKLVISVNGEYLASYCADGIIISTPTGSTGYSMSAGGPIVDPKAQLLLLTPINPQTLSARSIVVGADAEIEVMLAKRRPELDEEAEVSFDGDRFEHMKVGDRFQVKQADVCAKIMKLDHSSFLQILRKKMQQ